MVPKECTMRSRRKHRRTRQTSGTAAEGLAFRRGYSGSLKTSGGGENLIDEAVSIWQKHSDKQLTREDGREIVENLTGFFGILREWRFAERVAKIKKAKKSAAPAEEKAVAQEGEGRLTVSG